MGPDRSSGTQTTSPGAVTAGPGRHEEGDEHMSVYEPRADAIAEHDAALERYQRHFRSPQVQGSELC